MFGNRDERAQVPDFRLTAFRYRLPAFDAGACGTIPPVNDPIKARVIQRHAQRGRVPRRQAGDVIVAARAASEVVHDAFVRFSPHRRTTRFAARHLRRRNDERRGGAEPYVIGAILSESGPGSTLGRPEADSMRWASTRSTKPAASAAIPKQLTILDDQSDATTAVNDFRQLLDKHPIAIFRDAADPTSLAIAPLAEPAHVPLVSYASSVSVVSPVAQHQWVFKVPINDTEVAKAMQAFMKKRNTTKVSFIYRNDDYGKTGMAHFDDAGSRLGFEIVSTTPSRRPPARHDPDHARESGEPPGDRLLDVAAVGERHPQGVSRALAADADLLFGRCGDRRVHQTGGSRARRRIHRDDEGEHLHRAVEQRSGSASCSSTTSRSSRRVTPRTRPPASSELGVRRRQLPQGRAHEGQGSR